MSTVLVIADDFSGAAEIAGMALRFGIPGTILRHLSKTHPASPNELTVIDTDSRALPPDQAAEKIRQALHSLPRHTLLFKKIDSVLRGPILAEIDAALTATGRTTAIVLPANPSRNRIIRDGHYYIAGVPLHQTEFAQDPQYPALTSNVIDRIAPPTPTPHLYNADPTTPLRPGIALANVTSPADVHAWAARITPNTLPVGGADFFTALLQTTGHRPIAPSNPEPPKRTFLLVSGTTSATAHQALERAAAAGIPIRDMPPSVFANTPTAPADMRTWQQHILHDLQTHARAIAAIRHPLNPSRATPILNALTETIATLLPQLATPCELFVEGGATAAHLSQRLGWHTFATHHELAPGVVRLAIPQAPTRWLTLKPGSYPWPATVWECFGVAS